MKRIALITALAARVLAARVLATRVLATRVLAAGALMGPPAQAQIWPTLVSPKAVTTTNESGSVTAGGSFQSVIAASPTRAGCFVMNPASATETLYVFFGANTSATTAASVALAPGSSVNCATGTGVVLADNVSVEAATTGHAFVAMSQ